MMKLPEGKVFARNQPCGCKICYCEGEKCNGCGATRCNSIKDCSLENGTAILEDDDSVSEIDTLRSELEEMQSALRQWVHAHDGQSKLRKQAEADLIHEKKLRAECEQQRVRYEDRYWSERNFREEAQAHIKKLEKLLKAKCHCKYLSSGEPCWCCQALKGGGSDE